MELSIRKAHDPLGIKEFLDKYGIDSTTNFQLLKWSKDLGFKVYCIMRNELDKLNKLNLKTKPLYIICNYQTTKDSGSHWICMYRGAHTSDKGNDGSYYFDSYGIQPFPEAIDFLEEGVYSAFKIQPDNSKMCGQLCLFVLYKLSKGEDFYKTVLNLNEWSEK